MLGLWFVLLIGWLSWWVGTFVSAIRNNDKSALATWKRWYLGTVCTMAGPEYRSRLARTRARKALTPACQCLNCTGVGDPTDVCGAPPPKADSLRWPGHVKPAKPGFTPIRCDVCAVKITSPANAVHRGRTGNTICLPCDRKIFPEKQPDRGWHSTGTGFSHPWTDACDNKTCPYAEALNQHCANCSKLTSTVYLYGTDRLCHDCFSVAREHAGHEHQTTPDGVQRCVDHCARTMNCACYDCWQHRQDLLLRRKHLGVMDSDSNQSRHPLTPHQNAGLYFVPVGEPDKVWSEAEVRTIRSKAYGELITLCERANTGAWSVSISLARDEKLAEVKRLDTIIRAMVRYKRS